MALLGLPLELLDAVISLTVPAGIESFSLSCKAVYTRAASQILRHNELKKRWRCTTTHDRRRDTLRILHTISRDPCVAQYIESLSLWSGVRDDDEFLPNDDEFLPNEEDIELIKALVVKSELFETASIDPEDWWSAIKEENFDSDEDDFRDDHALHTTISLLSFLPNLKALQLPSGWYDPGGRRWEDGWHETKARLTAMTDALVAASKSSGSALSKLQYIIPSTEQGYESRHDLQCLEPFMSLDNLEEIYIVSCIAVDDGYTGIPFAWRFPSLGSSLRRIELAYCCIDADGLSILIQHTPLLEVFRYGHQTKWHGCEQDWNAGAFVDTLGEYCGGTITNLAITLDTLFGDIKERVASFTAFTVLEELEIDLQILCDPSIESHLQQDDRSEFTAESASCRDTKVPRLRDVLPGSIINVDINVYDQKQDEEALKALLQDFWWDREKFKYLDKVIVRQYCYDWAKPLLKGTGVKRGIYNLDFQERMKMPAWKRAFEWRVEGIRGLHPRCVRGEDVGGAKSGDVATIVT
ncbi:hypothetical protein FB567DRAFT_587446 [Paraphoma chrysanthemicola]|uniref:F-box domain-containing protein n=1 Tax=Paraphoma chrysanthemicola TaxID=798071 RepID=A0A8K0RGS8_9PLEO|nr:hypothetical protein FB567DRAFT_587446 [Paraphoma chrysanthemicola]